VVGAVSDVVGVGAVVDVVGVGEAVDVVEVVEPLEDVGDGAAVSDQPCRPATVSDAALESLAVYIDTPICPARVNRVAAESVAADCQFVTVAPASHARACN
jgi:hypothetical protein